MQNGMQTFHYRAINNSGLEIKGDITALSLKVAENTLRNKGFLVKSVNTKTPLFIPKKRFNHDDYIQFITEFIALIKAGLTVPEALEQCSVRPVNPRLSAALKSSLIAVREGAYLSDALLQHPDVFDSVMTASVKTGEMAGDLATPLGKYRIYLEHINTLNKKISQALIYPAFILSAMLIILTVLFIFVMPRFTAIYADFDAELPGPTKLIFYIASNFKLLLPLFMIFVIALFAGYKTTRKLAGVKRFIDGVILKIPVFGEVSETHECAGLARTLHTLLAGGMTLSEALTTAKESVKNNSYLDRVNKVMALINGGTGFAAASAEANLMPQTAIKLLEAGEASGTMTAMLDEIASYYEQIIESRVTSLMTIIEPAMIFITGILVGGIIIVMYLPIFKLTEIVK